MKTPLQRIHALMQDLSDAAQMRGLHGDHVHPNNFGAMFAQIGDQMLELARAIAADIETRGSHQEQIRAMVQAEWRKQLPFGDETQAPQSIVDSCCALGPKLIEAAVKSHVQSRMLRVPDDDGGPDDVEINAAFPRFTPRVARAPR